MCGSIQKIHVVVVAQGTGEKTRHEGAGSEADSNPLPFPRPIEGGGLCLRSTESEKSLSAEMGYDHFETVCSHGGKRTGPLAVAAPNLFNEGMDRRGGLQSE